MTTEEHRKPDWFRKVDYTYLNSLDVRGWRDELLRVNDALALADWREEWRDVIGPESDKLTPAVITPLPVEVINRDEAARELHKFEMPAMLMRIHLGAPDAVIIAAVKAALLDARKMHPAPVTRPGKPALGSKFDKTKFASWRKHKIVQLADLLAWREREKRHDNGSIIRKADIGRWLFPFPNNPTKCVEDAEMVLRQALASIPALQAQALP